MIKKTNVPRILDTSALVHDPRSLYAYQDDVYICLTVLEELDNLKERRDKSVSADARFCIRMLEDLTSTVDTDQLINGIELQGGNKLFIAVDTKLEINESLKHDLGSAADNRIINFAFHLKEKLKQEVKIVTRDINMRLKARSIGVEAEDVAIDNQISDIDLLYSGVQHFEGDFFDKLVSDEDFTLSNNIYCFDKTLFNSEVQFNFYWYDDAGHIGIVSEVTESHVYTRLLPQKSEKIWGISPKNPRQAIAINQLIDPYYDLNIILGPAGSGKTFLAVAAALHHVLETKKYKKIVVVRTRDFVDDDPGFLPGDLVEKSLPLLGGVTDALLSMHGGDNNEKQAIMTIQHIIEKANIEFTSFAYIRGRSLEDCFVIFEEAANATKAQVKAMLSRASRNCKIACIGNLAQIDDRFVTPQTSGLSIAVNVFKKYDHCSVLIFDEVERSSLAAFTEKYF